VVVCALAFELGAGSVAIGFLPALLYSPLPLILWAAVRFGARGASGAVLIVAVVLTWWALNGHSLFIAGDSETNVFALQVFLLALSIPVLLLGTAIEEARRAERTTRERETQMAFAAASANIGLWQYDHAGDRFWATEHCRDMLGIPAGAALTWETIRNGVQPDDRDALTDLIRAARIEAPAEHEFRVRDADGRIRWIAARARTDFDALGTPMRVSGLFTDITSRKVAQHEIDLQRRELAHLMRVGMVGELSGAIAHELNQPLTAILANAQAARRMLAQTSPNAHELEETLDDIVRDDHRAGEVIGRLRGFLKKDAGQSEPVDLNGLVEAALRLLHSELVSRMVKVELNLQPELPPAFGDPVQLQQVLLNVVMNAVEAMSTTPPADRIVSIVTRSSDQDRIEVVVADRGCGLSTGAKSRLFEPFFTTKEHGLGLGLSICSTIVKSHGGELGLAGNAHGGATATMTLPERTRDAHKKRMAAT
jgi:PAS domain S-box-containing protein